VPEGLGRPSPLSRHARREANSKLEKLESLADIFLEKLQKLEMPKNHVYKYLKIRKIENYSHLRNPRRYQVSTGKSSPCIEIRDFSAFEVLC
jgi:hypothetical protein